MQQSERLLQRIPLRKDLEFFLYCHHLIERCAWPEAVIELKRTLAVLVSVM